MEKLTYSVREAAVILGISKSLTYQLAQENAIPVLRLGNRIVIPKQRLEEFVNRNLDV